MDAREITDRAQWDAFVLERPEAQFLQSWGWGDFQHAVGHTVVRLGVLDGGRLLGAIQLIQHRHPFGRTSLYIPRGPVVDDSLSVDVFASVLTMLLRQSEQAGRLRGAAFLRIDPPFLSTTPPAALIAQIGGWRSAPSLQPANSLLLPLLQPLDELLGAMHEKTRYNIRLAERKGVTVEIASDDKAMQEFLRLLRVTAQRDRIVVHPLSYYRTMLTVLGKEQYVQLFLARYKGQVIAANIVAVFGDTVIYMHGASSNAQRNVMAPHLLQWHQIRWAKELGARWYDFWGIAPSDASPSHKWTGITRFKRGFGGGERAYAGGFEKPLNNLWYAVIRMGRKLRR